MGKEEIAHCEQFLLFPQCFQKTYLQSHKNQGLFGKGLKALKEFADDNFTFHTNARNFSEQLQTNVGKGQIALCEQFLLFSLCFQKTYLQIHKKLGLVWERVKSIADDNFNPFPNKPWFLHVCSKSLLKTLWERRKCL